MTFKEYVHKLAEEQGCKLFSWQEDVINKISDAIEYGTCDKIAFARGSGKSTYYRLLKGYFEEELKEKDYDSKIYIRLE